MAEVVVFDGVRVKKRSPIGIWVLTVLTLTVYWNVRYFKINDEARRVLRDETIKPWKSVLAIVPGFLLLFIPVFVSAYRTGQRIERMETNAGIDPAKRVRPAIGFLWFFLTIITLLLLLGGGAYYYQQHLNAMWSTADAEHVTPAAP